MTNRLLFVLTIFLLAVIECLVAQQQARADISCSGLIDGGRTVTNISDNVTVPADTACTFIFVNVQDTWASGRMQPC
jgi:hypothetical protein